MQTRSVPPLLSSALISHIYKQKGDQSEPTNNRPVSFTSAFRRLISTALITELQMFYSHSEEHQWGFQKKTKTECEIIYAVNDLRVNLPFAALLDLYKAYDCVPRKILQDILDKRLPPALSTMFRPLLWTMRLRTKGQKSPRSILTLAGMLQCDRHVRPSCGVASLFFMTYSCLSGHITRCRNWWIPLKHGPQRCT